MWEHVAACKFLIGASKHFSVRQDAFGLLQIRVKLNSLTLQSFQWLHSRQSRDKRLLDDLGHPIRDPLRFVADLIFDPDLNVFIRFDTNLRSRSKVIPCPIEGARPVDQVVS